MAAPIARVRSDSSEVSVEVRTDLPLGEPMRVRVVVVVRAASEQHHAHILLGGFGGANGPSVLVVPDAALAGVTAAVVGVVERFARLAAAAARSVAQVIESLQRGAAGLVHELDRVVLDAR